MQNNWHQLKCCEVVFLFFLHTVKIGKDLPDEECGSKVQTRPKQNSLRSMNFVVAEIISDNE